MIQQIKNIQKEYSKSLNKKKSFKESFEDARDSSNKIMCEMKELESATKSQTGGIEEVSQSIQSIATAIQSVALNATKAMEMMHQSEQITQNISASAEKGMSKMNSMKSIVSESSNDVKKLATELAKVDNMTCFITTIAEQTNLLALNAAIEAARAGDVGRGFAVVADEVRGLAENSKKGAKDISELINSLKDSSDKTTDGMDRGNLIVQEAYDVITNILASINDITSSITEVVSQMQEISAATEEIASGAEEATAASEEILSVAQTNLRVCEESKTNQDHEVQCIDTANTLTNTLVEISNVLDHSLIVSITDVDGLITFVNKQFLDIARFPSEELMGESHRLLKSGWHDKGVFDLLWKTISGGKMFQGYIRNRAKDGTIYWVKTTISPTFDKNNNIKGYVGVRTPMTEFFVMTGIESACKDMEAGKPVKAHLKEVVEKLRVGNYTMFENT